MLILATFFPESLSSSQGYFAEFLRSSVDIIDLLGIALVLSRIPGKGHSKLISIGLGWATAELVFARGLLLLGARGAEFSWIYIQKCLEANILLVQHLSTTTLLWLHSRHDLNRKYAPLVILLLVLINYRPVWLEMVLQVLAIGPWTALAFKALVVISIGVVTVNIYAGLAQQIGL